MQAGILFYIVGASGVGKDTLVTEAMRQLRGTHRYVQARRVITRPAGNGEDHEPVDDAEFDARISKGAFLHTWAAHGLRYGLPLSIADDLRAGRNVIANGSRAAIPEVSEDLGRLVVIEITAPREVLRERITSRGRETAVEVEERLTRAVPPLSDNVERVLVVNDSTVEEGAGRLVSALELHASRFAIRKLPISSASGHIAYLPEDSRIVEAKAYADVGRIDIAGTGASVRAAVNIVGPGLLSQDELGLSREAFEALGLREGALVSIQRTPSPSSRRLLQRKIAGERLGEQEYGILFRDIVDGCYPESETAAFLVKMLQTLDEAEVVSVAKARCQFMQRIDWGDSIVVDKHSLGGIPGSRITLIVVPIVAAHGLLMPKTSSRAITSASGTADVMEAICRIDLNAAEVYRVVKDVRGCIAWNGRLNHSVLDDVVNSIARPLDVNNNYWSVASILSKKWTAGSTHVVVDMPYGPRAKLKSLQEANELGRVFEFVGSGLGLTVRAKATDGSRPIGRGIGPALEFRDVCMVLDNHPDAVPDLREKALVFAAEILSFDPAIGSVEKGRAVAEKLLISGAARARFDAIVDAQGRVPKAEQGPLHHTVHAPFRARVLDIDGWHLAGVARRAGAPFDKGAGIDLLVRVGDEVLPGAPLYTIYASAAGDFEAAVTMSGLDMGITLNQKTAVASA
ncbi:phosphonate metabolism protein/1,5-bisphosphokinase (PRPP-forming) PhnN [Bradyrhizobium erythrophlei]|uniref:Ribose 1,5-bisphosphate phosphokinase PhnN n=1 Tax=Bradyrhizobium erythrophlei TaxID=1437360 RepID=A0A1M7STL5_9BRAD|nr:phosphonate metabolism protein/1,5-bisphosphokinase (PRPP-forming) PhnN [Bradyrhizobium erythrophlei]SHN61758.1 thymidine phosphorylase [Bradyrhizobium erythrophlei]